MIATILDVVRLMSVSRTASLQHLSVWLHVVFERHTDRSMLSRKLQRDRMSFL